MVKVNVLLYIQDKTKWRNFNVNDNFFFNILHANDNAISELGLWHMAEDMIRAFKKSLRREIFGRKGRCHTCKGFIEYQGDGKWGIHYFAEFQK